MAAPSPSAPAPLSPAGIAAQPGYGRLLNTIVRKPFSGFVDPFGRAVFSGTSPRVPGIPDNLTFDVAVVGGGPAGFMAATTAANQGVKTVWLVAEPDIGGMFTQGGLCALDIGPGHASIIGGQTWKVLQKIGAVESGGTIATDGSVTGGTYPTDSTTAMPATVPPPVLFFQPKNALKVFTTIAAATPNLTVVRGASISSQSNVSVAGLKIMALETSEGVFGAKAWVDATYDGDLMAWAGCAWTYGREAATATPAVSQSATSTTWASQGYNAAANITYGESAAGIQAPVLHFQATVSGYSLQLDTYGNPLSPMGPSDYATGNAGLGDSRIMSNCYRHPVVDGRISGTGAGVFKSFPVPPGGYNADIATYVLQFLCNFNTVNPGIMRQTFGTVVGLPSPPVGIAANKICVNSQQPVGSIDFPGGNQDWPYVSPASRAVMARDHYVRQANLYYGLQNDARFQAIPGGPALQADALNYGLPADEFPESGGWAPLLYPRVSRRMIGAAVTTQADCITTNTKTLSIGKGNYNFDTHTVGAFLKNGAYYYEGPLTSALTSDARWQIQAAEIVPRASDITNLVVPVCSSRTSVVSMADRVEPTMMIKAEAAGAIAAAAVKTGRTVQALATTSNFTTYVQPVLQAANAIR